MLLTWQPSQWTRAQLEERRLSAKPLMETGELNTTQIAQITGVSPSTVRAWHRRLTDKQIATVMALLQAGPDPARFPDERWTCPRVREMIGLRFDVWYDMDHVSRLLHLWGFSPQKPD